MARALSVVGGRLREVVVPDAARTSVLAAAATSAAITYAASGLAVPLDVGTWRVTAGGSYQTAATLTGIGLQLAGTAGLAVAAMRTNLLVWGVSATTATPLVQTALAPNAARTTGVAAANTPYPWSVDGIVRVTTAGTLTLELVSEVLLSTVTVHPLSFLTADLVG